MRILVSVLLLGLSGYGGCAVQPESPESLEFMWQIELPQSEQQALLFYHRRDGGIHVRSAGENQAATEAILWRGWWPLHLYAPTWLDDSTLAIGGTFIAGVGPTGNRPFDATLHFSYDSGGWQALEPVLAEPPFEKPIELHCGPLAGVEIRNAAALGMLPRHPDEIEVDYARDRLILLHDPAVSSLEPQVRTSESGYHLTWVGEVPLRTSAYARPGTLWIVLPADGRSLSTAAGADMADCQLCRAGVSLQPLQRWIFTPATSDRKSGTESASSPGPCRPVGHSGPA